jgi:hypothetical protein
MCGKNETAFDSIRNIQVKKRDLLTCDTINFSRYFTDVLKSYDKTVLTFQKRLEYQFSTIKLLTLESDLLTKKNLRFKLLQ